MKKSGAPYSLRSRKASSISDPQIREAVARFLKCRYGSVDAGVTALGYNTRHGWCYVMRGPMPLALLKAALHDARRNKAPKIVRAERALAETREHVAATEREIIPILEAVLSLVATPATPGVLVHTH